MLTRRRPTHSESAATANPLTPISGHRREAAGAWHDGRVTWTAPEVTRPEGPLAAGEREMLQAFLDWHRATLLHKCAGLTGEKLVQHYTKAENVGSMVHW